MKNPLPSVRTVRAQQVVLFVLLLGGLAAYFGLAWYLRVKEYIINTDNLDALHRVASQLFLPYIGVAFGGVFGAARANPYNVDPDPYVFTVAASSVAIWDLLAIGNVAMIILGAQTVEDVVRFSETTMPLLSTLVAGSVSYYFGTQSGVSAHQPAPAGAP
jgi:hypothetical protein